MVLAVLLLLIVVIAGLTAMGVFILASRKKNADRPTMDEVARKFREENESSENSE